MYADTSKLYSHAFIDECEMAVESEENMRNYDYNDDFANMIDRNIYLPGVHDTYRKGKKHEWIIKVDNEVLQEISEMKIKLVRCL